MNKDIDFEPTPFKLLGGWRSNTDARHPQRRLVSQTSSPDGLGQMGSIFHRCSSYIIRFKYDQLCYIAYDVLLGYILTVFFI